MAHITQTSYAIDKFEISLMGQGRSFTHLLSENLGKYENLKLLKTC